MEKHHQGSLAQLAKYDFHYLLGWRPLLSPGLAGVHRETW